MASAYRLTATDFARLTAAPRSEDHSRPGLRFNARGRRLLALAEVYDGGSTLGRMRRGSAASV